MRPRTTSCGWLRDLIPLSRRLTFARRGSGCGLSTMCRIWMTSDCGRCAKRRRHVACKQSPEPVTMHKNEQPFLTDVTELRTRAQKTIESGPVTPNYGGDVKQTIGILQNVLATELVCVLRYTMNAVTA